VELLASFVDIVLHLDVHLLAIMQTYGMWIYVILFMIIFCETGLVVMPFLPGDSLLFVVGALCGVGALEIKWILPLLMAASFSGDNTNYWIGRLIGMRLVKRASSRFLKHEHLEKTHMFYKKHGGKAILFARFLPIVRTFAPFVAGIGAMRYRMFMLFSALGSITWISLFTLGGYFLGNIPVVKDNLTLMVVIVIVISFLPALREFIRHRRTYSA
jgi:membrane-associated protein